MARTKQRARSGLFGSKSNGLFGSNSSLPKPPQTTPESKEEMGDYAHEYNDLLDDLLQDEIDEDELNSKKNKNKKNAASDGTQQSSYMLFDFRRGADRWPKNVELLSPADASKKLTEEREKLLKAQREKAAAKEGKVAGGAGDDDFYSTYNVAADVKHGGRRDDLDTAWGDGNAADSEDDESDEDYKPEKKEDEDDEDEEEEDGMNINDEEKKDENLALKRLKAAEAKLFSAAPEGATFENLRDGSTAFLVPAGWRLMFDLSEMEEGGDAARLSREKAKRKKEKEQAKRQAMWKKRGWGGYSAEPSYLSTSYWGGGGAKSSPKLNEWTVTIDLKLKEDATIPHNGISLLHTALVHAEEGKGRSSKLTQTNGETIINCDGGVGQLGTFGDVSKCRVEPGKWHRVVVSVKCAQTEKDKGELRTWIDSKPGCVFRSDEIKQGGRFELNLSSLFLFSSNDATMMPGGVLLRTVRVDEKMTNDGAVRQNRARDKILDVLNEERERSIDQHRAGLSLATLFPKPRPIWTSPAFIGTFGDAFIEGTPFEGSSCLAWSFTVLNHVLQKIMRRQREFFVGFSSEDFGKVSDALHVLSRSTGAFKEMARLLKNLGSSQLMSFLRRMKKLIGAVDIGDALLLPLIVGGEELVLILMRTSDRYFNLVVVASNPAASLRYHAVDASRAPPQIHYRTALVLNNIEKKLALDDVFWAATFNLTARHARGDVSGDLEKFYDLLLPFLTGKPLEQSLVEVEGFVAPVKEAKGKNSNKNQDTDAEMTDVDVVSDEKATATAMADETKPPAKPDSNEQSKKADDLLVLDVGGGGGAAGRKKKEGHSGSWRMPQRTHTAYVHCIFEALHFLLTSRAGLSPFKADQVQLAVQAQLMDMVANDLNFLLPEDNGRRACEMAISTFASSAVSMADRAKTDGEEDTFKRVIPKSVREKIMDIGTVLSTVAESELDLPPFLDLCDGKTPSPAVALLENGDVGKAKEAAFAPKTDIKKHMTQFCDHVCWEVEPNIPDPGRIVHLRKYDAVDMLLIKERAKTRDEAVDAIRLCDQICVQLSNQSHCVKNPKFLVLALIEHVFVQVIATPKPRAVPDMDAKARARSEQSRKRRAEKMIQEAEERLNRATEFAAFYKGGGNPNARRRLEEAKDGVKEAKKKAQEVLEAFGDNEVMDDDDLLKEEEEQMEGKEKGKEVEDAITHEDCYWDQDIHYELQVELLLCLQRLTEQFASAAMSIQSSRSLDARCMVVPGLIAAVADSVVRRLAVDRPSKFIGILLGIDVNTDRRLGFPGFGLSVGTFIKQVEETAVHYPELSVATTSVIDYFSSPDQSRLDKIFDWEKEFKLRLTRDLMKLLRHVCRALSWSCPQPNVLLVDGSPESSKLMKQFPELKAYRDIAFWWKYFLNPDVTSFPNHSGGDITAFDHMEAQLHWQFDSSNNAYTVSSLRGMNLACHPDPSRFDTRTGKSKPAPTHRFPSNAKPSLHCASKPPVKTEDDIIYCPNLPTFANPTPKNKQPNPSENDAEDKSKGSLAITTRSSGLNQRDSELLLSFLTVPYLRLSLAMEFFASNDRVHKLQSTKLRDILDSVVFELGRHLRVRDTGVVPAMVPTQQKQLLATSHGHLCNELHRTPASILRPLESLLTGALALDTGAVCDIDADDFNSGVQIILYVTRLVSRIENYSSFLIETTTGRHPSFSDVELREVSVDDRCLMTLQQGLKSIQNIMHSKVVPLLDEYMQKLHVDLKEGTLEDKKILNRNSRLACDLHAHRLLVYRNTQVDDLTEEKFKAIAGSFMFLTTRHTWNKFAREEGKLLVPEPELYEIWQVLRRRLVSWVKEKRQAALDSLLQSVVQTSSSTTGGVDGTEQEQTNDRWAAIVGPVGRFAVASSRTTVGEEKKVDVLGGDNDKKDDRVIIPSKPTMLRTRSLTDVVEVVADTEFLGVEIDLQIGQMTLRRKHLKSLDSNLANSTDVRLLFGEQTMQVSILEQAEKRKRYRLVGLDHDLEHWPNGHKDCPPLGERWDRNYDPSELRSSEKWIANLFEPVRTNFYDGLSPPPMQFLMDEYIPEEAEMVVLVGLHQNLGGIYKLVHIYRHLKCVNVFEVVSHGREWWYTLHLSTDVRFSLRELQPSFADRQAPYPKWWERGSGSPYPVGCGSELSNNLLMNQAESVVIKRDKSHEENLSGGVETFIPSRFLLGILPQSLLDSYDFWRDEAIAPTSVPERVDIDTDDSVDPMDTGDGQKRKSGKTVSSLMSGYQRLRGYPKKSDKSSQDTMLVVEFQSVGSSSDGTFAMKAYRAQGAGESLTNVLELSRLPGRSVRVCRLRTAAARKDLEERRKLASYLETLKILTSKRKSLAPDGHGRKRSRKSISGKDAHSAKKSPSTFRVGSSVEYDIEGTGKNWVPAEVLKAHPGGRLYDIEPKGSYAGSQTKVPVMFIRKPERRSRRNRFNQGENGAWDFEGLSDSEDEEWKIEEEEEEAQRVRKERKTQEEKDALLTKKNALSFEQLDRLGGCLAVGSRKNQNEEFRGRSLEQDSRARKSGSHRTEM